MNKRLFYVPFNALFDYVGTSTSEGMIVLSDIRSGIRTLTRTWSEVSWPATL